MSDKKDLGRNNDETLRPSTIMRNVYAVFPSFAMLAGMQLDVFTHLKDGPMEAKKLAGALGVLEDKLSPLLYLLVEAGLLEVENKRFSNTSEVDKYLVRGRPYYMGGLSGFFNGIWRATLSTAESIRTGKPQAKVDFHTLPEEELLKYFRRQIHSSAIGGREIAEKLDFSKYESLLDAGGGTGGVSIAICEKYPQIKATVADLPNVVQVTKQFIAEGGMSDRVGILETDLCSNSPEGIYDVIILRAVIQTLSKEQAQLSLEYIGHSLVSGGRILIFGNVLENSRLAPLSSLAFGLVFLNAYDHGKAYTEKEYREMLTHAGFKDIVVDYDVLNDGMAIVSATKQ